VEAKRTDVGVNDLKSALDAGAVVVDVRTPQEFSEGHVPGAINVPLDQVDPLDEQLRSLGAGKPLYLICRSGRRSAEAADKLAVAGFDVRNVTGGTEAWKAAGLPVE